MPYLLEDLVIDRVDLVDEGANSAAFIELYKRKEQSKFMTFEEILAKMKPEHAAVISSELSKAKSDATEAIKAKDETIENLTACLKTKDETIGSLTARNTELSDALNKAKESDKACECDGEVDEDGLCKVCGRVKKTDTFDEKETFEKMAPNVKALFEQMKTQRDTAEAELRKAKDAERHAEAVAKAAELKSLPVASDKLVDIIKTCPADVVDVLASINAAIEGTVLNEVGKSNAQSCADAWSRLESKAEEVAKRDSITKQKAISVVIREYPDLYKEYLEGGAN